MIRKDPLLLRILLVGLMVLLLVIGLVLWHLSSNFMIRLSACSIWGVAVVCIIEYVK